MTGNKDVKKTPNDSDKRSPEGKRPDWTTGLRQLYDSVVEEPLPDSFADLLSKFDSED